MWALLLPFQSFVYRLRRRPDWFQQKFLQPLEELNGLIEKYFANQSSRLKIPKERWVYINALCKDSERIIPQTMRSISHGVSPTPCEDWIYLDQLHKQLLKIVSHWRAASQMSEKYMIIDALNKANQNDEKAANLLGISRRTLRKKIKGYDLQSSASTTPDLDLSDSVDSLDLPRGSFMIQPEVEGWFHLQRDNSFLWEGAQSITGRELCIDGFPYTFYHREIIKWLSGHIPSLIETTSVGLRDDKDRFIPDQYFEIVARLIVGFIELPVVDLPEVFRIEGYGNRVFFHSNMLTSFHVRFPAASVTFRIPGVLI